MADDARETGERKAIGGELILPVAAVIFTIYYFTTIREVPWTAQVSAVFVGSVLIALCAAFGLKMFFAVRRGDATLGFAPLVAPRHFIVRRLVLAGLAVGYVMVIDWLGFTITTFLFLAAAMLLLGGGRRRGTIMLLSALLAVGGYLLFIVAFKTRFPVGPFEALMKALF